MSRFINTELKLDSYSESESDSEVELKSDTELMTKLESDSEYVISLSILCFNI